MDRLNRMFMFHSVEGTAKKHPHMANNCLLSIRRHSCPMFEDQQTCFSLLVNKLNCIIASIRADLRRHALDIGNHMCQMAWPIPPCPPSMI